MIQPKIVEGQELKCIGQFVSMSVSKNRTGELWSGFMPRIKEIQNRIGTNFISLQVYPASYHSIFKPELEFEKWALVHVSDFGICPLNMRNFTINAGLFAVFEYKGSSRDPAIFQYIYSNWIPKSTYILDNRPHFEVLGSNYKNNDSNSEEEIWIPIKKR